ncbi:MAG: PEGA domain-containing protein [bacterium]|nr:PEGA domain-containing protein [bacterium]
MIKVEKRKIYWFFIYPVAALTFAVISVLFIMSARGYNMHFEKNGIVFVKTGMLIVSSKPTGAKIVLDGKDTSKKTNFFSVKINNLSKKKHVLTLEKEGYFKWEKEINIVPEMVTWANYVLMFSKNPKIDKVDFSGSLVQSVPSLDNRQNLVLTRTKDSEVLYSVQNSTGGKNVILDTVKIAEDKRMSGISVLDWSKDKRNVLITGSLKSDQRFWVVNMDSKSVDDVSTITPLKFSRIMFSTANNDELYGSLNGELMRVNIRTKSVSNVLESHISYFSFSENGKIYYIKDDKGVRSLFQANGDLGGKVDLSDAIPVSEAYTLKVDLKDQKALLKTKENNALYLLTKVGDKNSLITIGKNISDFAWAKDSIRFFYKIRGANVVVFESDDYKKESVEYNIAGSEKFQNILWYDPRHLLFQSGDKAMIMDFDGTNRVVLGDSLDSLRIFFTADNGDIYFFSPSVKQEQALLSRYRVEF